MFEVLKIRNAWKKITVQTEWERFRTEWESLLEQFQDKFWCLNCYGVRTKKEFTIVFDIDKKIWAKEASTCNCTKTICFSYGTIFQCLLQSELLDLYHQFSQCITTYKDFWDMMSEIDRNTWVLEPDKPTYSALHRRIAISMFHKNLTNLDTRKKCFNYPKIRTMWFYHTITCPDDADRIARSSLIRVYTVCPEH